ncbi:MAG: FMN-binding protein [bacterium]
MKVPHTKSVSLDSGFRKLVVTIGVIMAGFMMVSNGAQAAKESKFYARRYMTKQQAIQKQKRSPEDVVQADTMVLTDSDQRRIFDQWRVRFHTDTHVIHQIFSPDSDEPYRFAVFLQQPGQHEYMDLMYGINRDGTVHRIDLLVYREPHGGEVKQRRFMRQFENRSLQDSEFRVNVDVVHISGATISAKSIARGTRKVLGMLRTKGLTKE